MSNKASTNSERDPYLRDDLWEDGPKSKHFGYLWKRYAKNPSVISRLNDFAKEAKKNNQRALA